MDGSEDDEIRCIKKGNIAALAAPTITDAALKHLCCTKQMMCIHIIKQQESLYMVLYSFSYSSCNALLQR